jgi:hypothetical protein
VDRDVMVSPALLAALREHWSRLKPKVWLFPGNRWHTAPQPIGCKALWHACYHVAQRAFCVDFTEMPSVSSLTVHTFLFNRGRLGSLKVPERSGTVPTSIDSMWTRFLVTTGEERSSLMGTAFYSSRPSPMPADLGTVAFESSRPIPFAAHAFLMTNT